MTEVKRERKKEREWSGEERKRVVGNKMLWSHGRKRRNGNGGRFLSEARA